MKRRRAAISDTELEVLQVLWDLGPAAVRDVRAALQQAGRTWAYNTVQTLLSRLVEKGFVAVERRERAHLFSARRSRGELVDAELRQLADRLCAGSPTPLVEQLLNMGKLSPADIQSLRRLLDQQDPPSPRSPEE